MISFTFALIKNTYLVDFVPLNEPSFLYLIKSKSGDSERVEKESESG